jgi:hypothetical protein
MLWSWGHIFPSFIQKCAILLLEDLEAFQADELDMSEIGRLANVFLRNSLKGFLGLSFSVTRFLILRSNHLSPYVQRLAVSPPQNLCRDIVRSAEAICPSMVKLPNEIINVTRGEV